MIWHSLVLVKHRHRKQTTMNFTFEGRLKKKNRFELGNNSTDKYVCFKFNNQRNLTPTMVQVTLYTCWQTGSISGHSSGNGLSAGTQRRLLYY